MLSLIAGIRVLDLTTVVLGPYATQILADLGADVLKVEPHGGDVFRAVRPGHSDELGAGFLNTNRNKRSIVIDLRRPEGRSLIARLARDVDVVVHNMRPRSARKLGIDFETLSAGNDRLVYCYAPGFGQDGPKADEPAYDDTIQAASGLAYLNANQQGEPRFLPTIVADKVGGLHLAIAVLAALSSPRRGRGAICVEAPMFESLVSFLMVEQLSGRSFDPPLGGIGYDRLLSPYRRPFPTADGFVSIIPYTAQHWTRFLTLVDRADLADDPRVQDPVQRSRQIDMLYAIIAEATPRWSTDAWIALLREHDIPHARVNRPEELFEDGHLAAVGMFPRGDHPSEGGLVSVRTPFRVPGSTDASADTPAPLLGEHTLDVLRQAGLGSEEIARLAEQGVVAGRGIDAAQRA